MNKLTIRQAAIQDLSKLVPIFDDYREYFGQQKNLQRWINFYSKNLSTLNQSFLLHSLRMKWLDLHSFILSFLR